MLQPINSNNSANHFVFDAINIKAIQEPPHGQPYFQSDNGNIHCACINCVEPHCLRYYNDEYLCPEIKNYSARSEATVCAFNALAFDEDGYLVIDDSKCVHCGLCSSRCPFGAIYYDGTKMIIKHAVANGFYSSVPYARALELQRDAMLTVSKLPHSVDSSVLTFQRVDSVYKRIRQYARTNEVELLFCRNLLIAIGFKCALRRTGLASMRMDAILTEGDTVGVVEIEFHGDSLSSARNLLDDLLMMASRCDIPLQNNVPIALYDILPNTRQDFYQVCDDIKAVLGISIQSLTIGALLLLAWGRKQLPLNSGRFQLGFRNTSIKDELETILGFQIVDYDSSAGYFEPRK